MNYVSTNLKGRLPNQRKVKGMTFRSVLYSILALLFLGVGGFYAWNWFFPGTVKHAGIIQVPVTKGTFIHEINGKGNAESAKNIDITCQVEGSSTIIWIIQEGEVVKEGSELVLLDSSNIEDKLNTQQITYNTSLAKVASSQATLRTAELSLEEYIEGTFEQNWTTTENSIYSAKETQKQKGDSVRFTERLVQLGYTTTAQLDVDKVSEQSAINTVKSSVLEQEVLLKYTSEKKITSLMSDIETARADVNSNTYTNQLDKNRLDYYRKQFENCTIKAPQDGQVVYANQDNRRWASESEMIKEGASVRERQVLIRLPDPSQMQVKAMINEASISSVKTGMKAIIAFDAITNRTFEGTVIKVNQYPEVVWMSSAKDYVTIIKIDDSSLDIRSGLTAEVRIIATKQENVLMLPIQCVIEVGQKTYCLLYKEGVWSYREVLLGNSNDKQVIILDGLQEGDTVVSGARQYKDKVEFPASDEPSKFKQKNEQIKAADPTQMDIPAAGDAKNPAPGNMPQGAMPGNMPKGMPGAQGGIPGNMPQGAMPGNMPKGMPGAQGGMPGNMPQGAMPGNMPKGMPGAQGGIPGNMPQGAMPGNMPKGMPNMKQMGNQAGPSGENGDRQKRSGTGKQSKTSGGKNGIALPSGTSTEKVQEEEAREEAEMARQLNRIKPIIKYFSLTAMEFCRKLDENRDKFIVEEEIKKQAPELLDFYKDWDRNKDGKWSQTDFVIGFCTSRNLYQKSVRLLQAADEKSDDNEGHSKLQELVSRDPQELFNELDKNKDKVLTSDEFAGKDEDILLRMLNRLDENQDGKLSNDEFVKGLTNFKNRMKRRN